MKKRSDWRQRLRAFLTEHADKPFQYGSADCGAFAGGAVHAMMGVNPHAQIAGRYKSLRGALRVIKRLGYADHIEFAAAFGEEVEPLFAQFGDIAVVDGEDGPALGVVLGPQIEARSPQGRAVLPLTAAKRAFRVPETPDV